MKRHVYRERDYAFAQMILTLRTTLGLSQAELGELTAAVQLYKALGGSPL